jgi:hypothetical protein
MRKVVIMFGTLRPACFRSTPGMSQPRDEKIAKRTRAPDDSMTAECSSMTVTADDIFVDANS